MGYLEDFQVQINNRDFSKFLQLWDEYSKGDNVEAEEFIQLLKIIKPSDFAKMFGQLVETALPLWQTIQDEKDSYEILKHLIDLQTTNTPALADLALNVIKKRYGHHPEFNERLRLVGLRTCENFQGGLSNYDLLAHIGKGKFVFHSGGWGAGEIIDNSMVREQLSIEFENVSGRKHITYTNAFKTLIPLADTHFLVRRFADPDLLEKEAREDPVAVIKMLLNDLGPKTALEIKDELCERVIPEEDWTKWWQAARARLKKDTMIESPEGAKGTFVLRKTAVAHEDRMSQAIDSSTTTDEVIQTSYSFVRDFPNMLKKEDVRKSLVDKLLHTLDDPALTSIQELQVLLLLDTNFSVSVKGKSVKEYVSHLKDIKNIIDGIDIIAIKKRAFVLVREVREDWMPLFCRFLTSTSQGNLRDYLIKELNQGDTKEFLVKELKRLIQHPAEHPDLFVWYFGKIIAKEGEDLPFSDKEGQWLFFEAFFILYNLLENRPDQRDLLKKMYQILSGKRYAVVRQLLVGTTVAFVKELLLLASKCQTLSDHDLKVLRSLVEVVHPTLAAEKPRKGLHDANIVWATEAGYLRTQERAKQIGTVEIVENAREIEAARALGDLRENSEYKFALEKRSRLQGELKTLSDQLSHARLITRDDISPTEAGIGSVVELLNTKNNVKVVYKILGQWDADVDAGILSFQSKLAQAMQGVKIGETFTFRDDEFKVLSLKSYLD